MARELQEMESQGIIEHSKLLAVQCFPIQKPRQMSGPFLGLTGYYRRFILDFATVAALLTDLVKKACLNKVQWSKSMQGPSKSSKIHDALRQF